jgi:hypothetical protein
VLRVVSAGFEGTFSCVQPSHEEGNRTSDSVVVLGSGWQENERTLRVRSLRRLINDICSVRIEVLRLGGKEEETYIC